MEIGLGLPNGGATVMTEDLVRLATGAEAAGLDATWTLERWLRPQRAVDVPRVPVPVELPADAYACVFHPLDLLAHLAALTRRVRLGTSAVLALLHPPVLLAHGSPTGCIPTEATLDELTADLTEFRAAAAAAGRDTAARSRSSCAVTPCRIRRPGPAVAAGPQHAIGAADVEHPPRAQPASRPATIA